MMCLYSRMAFELVFDFDVKLLEFLNLKYWNTNSRLIKNTKFKLAFVLKLKLSLIYILKGFKKAWSFIYRNLMCFFIVQRNEFTFILTHSYKVRHTVHSCTHLYKLFLLTFAHLMYTIYTGWGETEKRDDDKKNNR